MFVLIKLIYFISGFMSFKVLRKTGMMAGSVFFALSSKRRKIAIKNCSIIGAENPEQAALNAFRNNFATFAESLYTKRIDKKFLDSIEIENNDNIALPPEKPCFMLTAHIGAWELSGYIVSLIFKFPLTIIGRRMKNEKLDSFVIKQRTNEYIHYLHHRNIADKLGEELEKGRSVGALLDHGATLRDSFFVPFFGIKTTFIKGIPLIAARKNIPLLPVFLMRTEKSYRIIIRPMIYPDTDLKPKDRIIKIAEDINRVYEDIISRYPDQWFVLHKRFKKQMNENGEVTDNFYQ